MKTSHTFTTSIITSLLLYSAAGFASSNCIDAPRDKKGLRNGVERCYSKPDKKILTYEVHYVNDRMTGTAKTFDDMGKLLSIVNYKANAKDGESKSFTDGSLIEFINWKDGVQHGKEIQYFPKAEGGKPRTVTTWVNGDKIGPNIQYESDGSILKVEHVKPNIEKYTTVEDYYETGTIQNVEFREGGNTRLTIRYKLNGKIDSISCLPGPSKDRGYAYTVPECQKMFKFNIASWKPAIIK